MGTPEEDKRHLPLLDFHSFPNQTFPSIHSKTNLTKINTYELIYEFKGTDGNSKPALIAAHQDVVPANDENWTFPPFSGIYQKEKGLVWGRGSSDDKHMLLAIMNAWEIF